MDLILQTLTALDNIGNNFVNVCVGVNNVLIELTNIWEGLGRIRQNVAELLGAMRGNDLPVNGLTPERIEQFEHFAADESLVGEQCIVCLKDLEIGTQMVRLDCHVSHYLCKTCTDEWFKDHKTCPTCNHVFN